MSTQSRNLQIRSIGSELEQILRSSRARTADILPGIKAKFPAQFFYSLCMNELLQGSLNVLAR